MSKGRQVGGSGDMVQGPPLLPLFQSENSISFFFFFLPRKHSIQGKKVFQGVGSDQPFQILGAFR